MKESKKQIKAQLINEVQKQFRDKIAETEASRDSWRSCAVKTQDENRELKKRIKKLTEENEKMKLERARQDEWIERMQEFCNLPEKQRREAYLSYLDSIKAEKRLSDIISSLRFFFV